MNKELNESLKYLQQRMNECKNVWFESGRNSDTGVGYTFEKEVLKKEEDNLALPDLKSLEIKAQRMNTISKMTMFTKSPSNPRGANNYIRERYGAQDEKYPANTIHASFFGNRISTYKNKYGFKLESDDINNKLHLHVYNNSGKLLKNTIYWDYDVLKDLINKKISNIGFIEAQTKKVNGVEYFKYDSINVLMNPSLKNFIRSIDNGIIQFDLRMGIHRHGSKQGKPHDHGSAFRIAKKDFSKVFEVVKTINF